MSCEPDCYAKCQLADDLRAEKCRELNKKHVSKLKALGCKGTSCKTPSFRKRCRGKYSRPSGVGPGLTESGGVTRPDGIGPGLTESGGVTRPDGDGPGLYEFGSVTRPEDALVTGTSGTIERPEINYSTSFSTSVQPEASTSFSTSLPPFWDGGDTSYNVTGTLPEETFSPADCVQTRGGLTVCGENVTEDVLGEEEPVTKPPFDYYGPDAPLDYENPIYESFPPVEVMDPKTDEVPPFIRELFPVGSTISYFDGGETTVEFPPYGNTCTFTADDIFELLLIKEDNRNQKDVSRLADGSIRVTLMGPQQSDGVVKEYSRTELDEAVRMYHSFWDTDPLSEEGAMVGIQVISGGEVTIENYWKEHTPIGFKMSEITFTAMDTAMNGILGQGAMYPSEDPKVKGTGPVIIAAKLALQFIDFNPNPDGRPGQGQAGIFDKCGNQIGTAGGYTRAAKGEIVYKVSSYGGSPTVLNFELGTGTITDYGCFFRTGKAPPLKHPTPRALNHPLTFGC